MLMTFDFIYKIISRIEVWMIMLSLLCTNSASRNYAASMCVLIEFESQLQLQLMWGKADG